jgi:fructoselysine-6-P-deglycase FrlB-like protein
MSRIPMLDNILAQPASHRGLLTRHQGNATLRACAEKIRRAQGRIIFSGMGGSLFATLPAVSRCRRWRAPNCCTTAALLCARET